MDRIAPTVAGATRSWRIATGFIRLNWRLILALVINIALWWGIIAGARFLSG